MASAVSPETVMTVPAPASMSLRPRLRASTQSVFRRRCRTKPIVATDKRATGAPSIWRTESSSCPGTLSSHWVVSSPMPGCCGIGEAADIASAYAPSAGSPADGARLGSELSALSAWSATSGLVRLPRAALQGAPPRSEGFLTPFRRTGMSRPAGSRRRPDAVDGRSRAPNR